MSDDITHDLDLLDDWLAGKGYGEEAGLVLRALSLIHKQAREVEKLRAALNALIEAADNVRHWHDAMSDNSGMVVSKDSVFALWEEITKARAAAAALKETGNE